MADILTLENLGNLVMLCFLQAVLGFDNLLYISIESQRAPKESQKKVRFWGIIIAVALRVVLLFTMVQLIESLSEPFFVMNWEGVLEGGVNFATCVFVFGGVFIMYTAVKEIGHLLSVHDFDHEGPEKSGKSAVQVVVLIVLMNLIFSFDSVLSALAITDVFPILAAAILLSGLAMLLLADGVTAFIEKNRMYEVLGLFILLIVGVVLLGEAGVAAEHATHDPAMAVHIFGYALIPMSKTTFYFAVVVLFVVEFIQTGYKRKLDAERARGALAETVPVHDSKH
ncbi:MULTISPECIES: TerC family protein [Nioella]|jgi:predicted tellurium resistance membrane protein TerC|uniref:TerC family protein n=1 Tax=Nioella TaxID=1775424 RepID=UPI0008FD8B62|nr:MULTISPECIES: tellurium resistance protein TerC [Nioella]TBX24528.1 integral membrane protein TerC [Roseovarius sp. JS7-11]